VGGKFSHVRSIRAQTVLTRPALDQMKEVTAVFNTIENFSQQAGFGMPVFGRVRVASLRSLPMTTGAVCTDAGQKSAHMDETRVIDGYRLGTAVTVATGTFPGTSAWSPPI
jgi:hypothetical protein